MKHQPFQPSRLPGAPQRYRLPVATPMMATAALATMKHIVAALEAARQDSHSLFAVSLSPGFPVHGEDGEMKLWRVTRGWNAAVDGGALGFNRRHLDRAILHRPAYALIAQHGYSTWHYHGIVSVLRDQVPSYQRSAADLWRPHTEGGSMDLEPLHDEGWHEYVVRKLRPADPVLLRAFPEHNFFQHFPQARQPQEVHVHRAAA